jgi:methyl-accepting chemotaxis protein
MNSVTVNTGEASRLMEQVGAGNRQQITVIDQIGQALSLLERTAQITTLAASESASAGQKLNLQVVSLHQIVGALSS